MGNEKVKITVYGTKQLCASCVGAPDSKDTYEWLQAAIGRKYAHDNVTYEYIDIFAPPEEKKYQQFVARVFAEDLFYPIICVNDEIVAEGIPHLKTIFKVLDKYEIAMQP